MLEINATNLKTKEINNLISSNTGDILIKNCLGQRFIAAGDMDKNIILEGIPGNALGAYLNGSKIVVYGNVEDQVADTMNDGTIIVNGNAGDALGYSMRGGNIFIKGNVGYRCGIHMKEYSNKIPCIVVGGVCGSFLGVYLAGGKIIVLGLGEENKGKNLVHNFACYGMHGGKVFFRCKENKLTFPEQVIKKVATKDDLDEISEKIKVFSKLFNYDYNEIMNSDFTVALPNNSNPYKQMYVIN